MCLFIFIFLLAPLLGALWARRAPARHIRYICVRARTGGQPGRPDSPFCGSVHDYSPKCILIPPKIVIFGAITVHNLIKMCSNRGVILWSNLKKWLFLSFRSAAGAPATSCGKRRRNRKIRIGRRKKYPLRTACRHDFTVYFARQRMTA